MPELWQSNDDRDRVRAATDIVRLVGEHVALKPKGREYVGLCPFHDDHRPSMNVVPSKQIFHCFVCGAGGDAFSFVQRYFKMEFREALEFLAERGGVKLTPRRAQPPSADSPRSSRAPSPRSPPRASTRTRGPTTTSCSTSEPTTSRAPASTTPPSPGPSAPSSADW